MNRWMQRNNLKLTNRGEQVMVGLIGFGIVALCMTALLIDGILNSQIGA